MNDNIQKMNDSIKNLNKVINAIDSNSEAHGKMIKVLAQTQIRICNAVNHVLFNYKPEPKKKSTDDIIDDMFGGLRR